MRGGDRIVEDKLSFLKATFIRSSRPDKRTLDVAGREGDSMTHFIGNWGKLSLIFPLSKIMQLLYDQLAKEIGICRVTRLHANFLAQGMKICRIPKKVDSLFVLSE